jgi:hypothetical protein
MPSGREFNFLRRWWWQSLEMRVCCMLMSLNGFQKCAALVWRTRTFPEKTAQIVATINLLQHLYICIQMPIIYIPRADPTAVINFCVWHLRVCSCQPTISNSEHFSPRWLCFGHNLDFWPTRGRDTKKLTHQILFRFFCSLRGTQTIKKSNVHD